MLFRSGEKKSLASSAAADFFPVFPPSQLWGANPFRLCSRRQPQSSPCDPTEARASAPSPCPPRRGSRQASRAGECCSAPSLCAGISPLCPPHPCGCALLRGSEASPPATRSLCPRRGSYCVETFPPSQLPPRGAGPIPILLSLFFLLPYPGTWGVSCLLGGLRSSASVQWVFCRSSSTCRCIFDVFVRRKVICMSYSSTILKLLLR